MSFVWYPPAELVEESNVKRFLDAEGMSEVQRDGKKVD